MIRMPLLWRVFLSTSLAATVLFGVVGWLAQNQLLTATRAALDEELQNSLRAYEASWKARADHLASLGRVISAMPDVRSAFGTGDTATIRDTTSDLWNRLSLGRALFLVTAPDGRVIASLGATPAKVDSVDAVRQAENRFPAQGAGFALLGDSLYQLVITPVYVESSQGPALINVLVAGFPMDEHAMAELKQNSGGSEVMVAAGAQTIGSTLPQGAQPRDWTALSTTLTDVRGQPIGQLQFLRPLAAGAQRLQTMRWQIAATWAAAMLIALLITFSATRRVLTPVRELDVAAREIARGNYEHRVHTGGSNDEMARLGAAFNAMSESIQQSRAELIRQERINILGRLASSVVHDLKNPLAAIYSGAEMLVDGPAMPIAHTQRIAGNIYRASRQVLATLDDLTGLVRGKGPQGELCRVAEIAEDAWAAIASQRIGSGIDFSLSGDTDVEATLPRTRIQRVFGNLFANAAEAMNGSGRLDVVIRSSDGTIRVEVQDSGPGVPQEIVHSLFQPFTTARKKSGLGLGLALSRQAMLDLGGNLTHEPSTSGALFVVSVPARAASASAGAGMLR